MELDLRFFDELLRIPSVSSDLPAVNRAVEAMAAWLSSHGLHCTLEDLKGRRILYAGTHEGKHPDVLLNAHLDVVPAAPALFAPRTEGDRVWGRGTVDCKGNALVVAHALAELAQKHPEADVGAVFTTDEEVGGETTAAMVARGYTPRRMVCILDASPWSIANAQKGTAQLRVVMHGHGGHSSAPWALENPVDKLFAAWNAFRATLPKVGENDDHWCNTLTATVVRAGAVENMVPDTAEMTLNFRYTKDGDAEAMRDKLAAAMGCDVSIVRACPPVFCDEKNPELVHLRDVMQRAWPDHPIEFYRMDGATDSRHFVSLGLPIAILGVEGGPCHSDEEWVSLRSLRETLAMVVDWLTH